MNSYELMQKACEVFLDEIADTRKNGGDCRCISVVFSDRDDDRVCIKLKAIPAGYEEFKHEFVRYPMKGEVKV